MNTGLRTFTFALASLFIASAASAQERPTEIEDITAALLNSDAAQLGAPGALETSFESFTIGDINMQNGWAGQFANWQIAASNPNTGAQHVESVSDGFGSTAMFSPDVGIGSSPVNATQASLRLTGTGVTWDLVPQSPTATFVNTIVRINPDDTVSVLDSDGMGGSVFVPTGFTMPQGAYVDFGIEVDRTTFAFEVVADGTTIYAGTGFAGDIEQLVVGSSMEVVGSTLDVDDAAIIDGPLPAGLPESVPVPVDHPIALAVLLGLIAMLGLVVVRRFS